MRIIYQIPSAIQHLYRGVVWRILQPQQKTVYLTFDDGCIPQVTPKVLDILRQYNIKATFFLVGENISKHPELLQQIISEQHSVGCHTYKHLKGTKTPINQYLESIEATDRLIRQSGGQTGLFRPPYGKITLRQKRVISQSHKIILWDLITHDYNKNYSPQKILNAIQKYTRNGSIILFHDSIKAQDNMLAVLPKAIEYLLSQGYKFQTINP